jgi:succinyl-diaminopimelate desuccinylase
MTATLDLAKQLIQRPSVTPQDEKCQQILAERLSALGFQIEFLNFADVSNLWAVIGDDGPLFVFAGHTDVVPPGPAEEWQYPPFTATEADGFLYGRGAADMKGSLAAMITATERLLANKTIRGRLGFLITSDEEGIAINGTVKVIEELSARGIKIDYCLVGEPSSTDLLGDTIKIGRRGSLSGRLKVKGIQGHVAYPHLASNPIHNVLPALTALTQRQWDTGNDSFPPTSFQISNVHAGTGANNVIPESMEIDFNLRFSTELDANTIKQQINALLDRENVDYEIDWHLSGEPFLTSSDQLIAAVTQSIEKITGITTALSTAGGTSDGRFIAPTGTEVVELGPCNATIHKVNERVSIDELEQLSHIYQCVIEQLLL